MTKIEHSIKYTTSINKITVKNSAKHGSMIVGVVSVMILLAALVSTIPSFGERMVDVEETLTLGNGTIPIEGNSSERIISPSPSPIEEMPIPGKSWREPI